MSELPTDPPSPVPGLVVVTGANGLVGARVCAELAVRGVPVRAVVRRSGTAPALAGVEEHVADVADESTLAGVVSGAEAVVTTIHPMGSDRATQQRIGVEATGRLARAARDAGVARLVHVSTAAVYDRSPGTGDVAEDATLVGDDAGDYPVTKRDTEAMLAEVEGLTRVLVRPPAILGPGETSIWNTLRPEQLRTAVEHQAPPAEATFAWVHVDDLARLLATAATGGFLEDADPETGPVAGGCTVVNVAGEPASQRDYHTAVSLAVGTEPVWDLGPAWTGHIDTGRARRWGWAPRVTREQALREVGSGLRAD